MGVNRDAGANAAGLLDAAPKTGLKKEAGNQIRNLQMFDQWINACPVGFEPLGRNLVARWRQPRGMG